MSKSTSVVLVTVIILFQATISYGNAHLKRTKGTMLAGGALTFPVEWRPSLQTAILINAEPKFGLFFCDGLLMTLGAQLKAPIFEERLALGTSDDRLRWGFNVGLHYIWDLGWPFYPYGGVEIGYLMSRIDFSTIRANLGFPLGLLVPLNENVALNVGVALRVGFMGQAKVVESVRVEPGFLGVLAFF